MTPDIIIDAAIGFILGVIAGATAIAHTARAAVRKVRAEAAAAIAMAENYKASRDHWIKQSKLEAKDHKYWKTLCAEERSVARVLQAEVDRLTPKRGPRGKFAKKAS